ncbi:MAG: type II toxin-antitoxin system RelE/ParE family toxin [Aquabacterium sp.]
MVEIRQTARYSRWFESLRDRQAQARILVRLRRLQEGNPGQHRVLTAGVVEMKIDHGPGYRVYYTWRAGCVVLLLVGGDNTTQDSDIREALDMVKEL